MPETQDVSFNVKFLKESAKNLAINHKDCVPDKRIRLIKPILGNVKEVLTRAYRVLSGLAKNEQELSPAAEWLIDNFYIIQEQIVQIENDFPKEFHKTIPLISKGELEGLPRVYELVLNYLTHTDNIFEDEGLTLYIHSYQQDVTLELGEIWAIPIMIRLILVQKLAEKAARILKRKEVFMNVRNLLQKIEARELREPGSVVAFISDWLKSSEKKNGDELYLIELYNQLQVSGSLYEEEKRWFNYRFRQFDMPLEVAMRIEAQKQSHLQVSIQNAVISLRKSSETDWSDFVEECSVVENILRLDPSGHYPEMDFKTRDRYRRAVERLSRGSGYSEPEVAEEVLLLAEGLSVNQPENTGNFLHKKDVVKQHVGYYLAGEGNVELVKKIGYSQPLREKFQRILEKKPEWYLAAIIIHTMFLMVILWIFTDSMSNSLALGLAVLVVSFFPALDLSVSAINRFFAFYLPPRLLPKMAYKEGIPNESRTLVVVPTMFTSTQDVRRQIENLEIRALANPDPVLQFVLLSDYTDADEQKTNKDKAIIKVAIKAINELNSKYSSYYGNKFFILHRDRKWNDLEGVWMGWERKRGKLEELNRMLCDPDAKNGFTTIVGNFRESVKKAKVRFVITLDSDTRLPPDSARNLVRTIAHPLNRARYDPQMKRITKGYGIIQPRISIPPESSEKTWFARIFSGNVGLDPYSTSVSDIYQDLTGEAVFTGKGIYDVQAFHEVLDSRFPENRILSHDLIESTYLRAGLATDIELFDNYPSTYVSFSKRNHRWTRGDWQIATWLFGNVPTLNGKEKNTINFLSKWKIFDNLRRSLNPFFLTVFFVAGWFLLPGSGWIWTAAAFGILAFPIYISLSSDILNRPARVRWKLYLDKVRANLKINSLQAVFTVMILPHQAYIYLDAIFRTIYRLRISRKWLLEWTTASQIESASSNSLPTYIKINASTIIFAAGILFAAIYTAPQYMLIVIPFIFLWAGSPYYLWYISQPAKKEYHTLNEGEVQKLRIWARKTWFYFERFVNDEHFWLPPDNYQEDPPLPVAERTSPTNIGLALVSTQVAYNRGYITYGELLERLLNTLRSMDKLERFNGHFYNWYETRLGEALNPKYISTVDSGNLAAGLIVVKQAVLKEMNTIGVNRNICQGIEDTILTLKDIFKPFKYDKYLPAVCYNRIMLYSDRILEKLKNADSEKPMQDLELLKSLKKDAASICSTDLLPLGSVLDDSMMQDLLFWIDSPLRILEKAIDEIKTLNGSKIENISKFTHTELLKFYDNKEQGDKTVRLLNKWKTQADEIIFFCDEFMNEMDFSFLYLKKRGLFSIGYNVEKAILDEGTYDLIASEARIASYIAIAKADVPVEHWFRLSRRLTSLNHNVILLSWGGTMFEYLMPMLFMRSYGETLLSHTGRNVVQWQKEYGKKRNKPWGFSESAYGFINIDMHYQYRAFGAPGLGLKRGLAEEYVVAPYASMLSLMVEPHQSFENLIELEKEGGVGLHGFYDAIDYTPGRLNQGEKHRVIKTYMVHHHGMSLLAIENLLNNWWVQNCFHSDPRIKGAELILQERIPRGVPIKEPHPIDVELEPGEQKSIQNVVEHAGIDALDDSPPRLHLLGNGSYSLFLTHAGTGASSHKGITLNGWGADTTCDPLGFFFYIKDTESGKFWSSTHQPVRKKPDRYDTWFHNDKVITSRVDEWIETTTAVSVSPDHPMEIRKLTLTNYSQESRTLEITSYAEVVLNRWKDHISHPTFSKLFIQSDYLDEYHSILMKRRPRSEHEKPLWLVHTFAGEEHHNLTEPFQFETERSDFIGRGRNLSHPAAMDVGSRLNGKPGNVSDPIVSLRKNITLGPGEKAEFMFGLGIAESHEEAVKLADIYDNRQAANRVFDLSSVYSSVELNHMGITSKQAHYFQKLASWILYSGPAFRADEKRLRGNRKIQQDLWSYGISGDIPLIVFRINSTNELKQVKTLLKAHNFWRTKGIETELLFLNDHAPGYVDEVNEAILQAIEESMERDIMNKNGGVFLQRTDKMQVEDLNLILTVAHTVFISTLPDLSEWNKNRPEVASWREDIEEDETHGENYFAESSVPENYKEKLKFFNGYGGFSETGEEYHILIEHDPKTGTLIVPPAPWINVIANPSFGFIATERGAGYTWSENSRENKLTDWSNDPVTDPHSEAFFIRNEGSGKYWSPAPGPAPGRGWYRVIHGFGYTRFEHTSGNFEQELLQFVHEIEPVKISVLKIKNLNKKPQTVSVYRFLDRVMGIQRPVASRYVIQSLGHGDSTLYAQNHYNNEFAGRVAFASLIHAPDDAETTFTTDREKFIGRNRSLDRAAAPGNGGPLDNKIVTGCDPCAVFRTQVFIKPGETVEFYFMEGECPSRVSADELIERFRNRDLLEDLFKTVVSGWKSRLKRIQVVTPEPSMDVLLNGWLMYQNLCCRMWARTAFYQAGGAYGFRDQLQDAMAVLYSEPELARKQIHLHAQNQFKEGDVLHWWHPPTGRGIRSKISDDRLWLPYVTDFYVSATGDESIMDEMAAYIDARDLEEHEHEVYLLPEILTEKETIYEHCCRAIDISLQFGEHGLPLIGAGDWNDGMNRVGEGGKGESVWLGFFIYDILRRFEKICSKRGDSERARRYRKHAADLKKHLNKEGWDGEWFLRAFYDDGTPMGSSSNRECRIDAISQAWSVLSGAAEDELGKKALNAAEKHLISEQEKIIRLLHPPFDQTEKNPGYIKGYIPGVRENGGQYTHGALWLIKAFAKSGMGNKAVHYFNMINPVNHTLDKEKVRRYKAEPYVVAADVYGEPPLNGMAGWSWYTGSGGWMYRVALESVLGFSLSKNSFELNPSISKNWPEYDIRFQADNKGTEYHIRVENPEGLETGKLCGNLDGNELHAHENGLKIRIKNDGKIHSLNLKITSKQEVNSH